jgi:competence protein ComEC
MAKKPDLFVRLLLPFCVGIWVLRTTENTELNSVIPYFLISLVILIFIIRYLYKSTKVYNHINNKAFTLYLLLFFIGGWRYLLQDERCDSAHFSRRKAGFLKVFITDEPTQKGSVIRLNARIISAFIKGKKYQAKGNILLLIQTKAHQFFSFKYGTSMIIPAKYSVVPPPYNPGEFDFRAWLGNRNIYHQAFLNPEEIILTGEQNGMHLTSFLLDLRQRQTVLYRKLIRDDEAFAVAAALILGYRSDLNAETLAAYSRTGTIHALSVSGMHVGIIYLILEWALKWMNRNKVLKWLKVLLILSLIWFYTGLTGCSASVLRSAIMLTFFIIAKALRKEANSYHVLALSAFCLLLYDPFLFFDAGWQLSYLAVLGLVWLQPGIESLIRIKWQWLQKLWSMISLSIAAQLLTSPFSVYYFHQFPVYFIFSNLFIVLPVTILMYSGIAILLFRLFWLAPAFEWLICRMNEGLSIIAKLPFAVIDAIWLSKTEFLLLCLSLICLLTGIKSHRKIGLWAGLLLLLMLQLLLAIDKFQAVTQRKILLFSLNKSYAVAFVTGRAAALITDLNTTSPAFKFHIQPALDQMRVTQINCLPWGIPHNHGPLHIFSNQLRFHNFTILLADSSLNSKTITGKAVFNAVWLHLNPQMDIEKLQENVRFQQLWVDGTNKSYMIKKFLGSPMKYKQRTTVLIKNNSSLINLK